MEMENKKKKGFCLPEELIVEIILRLPVKSLVRFKCVCKSWLSLISHPNFANSHFQFSAAPTRRLVSFKPSQVLSIDPLALFHDKHTSFKLHLPFPKPLRNGIEGSCRGFILLCFYHSNYFMLWNPSTGFHKRISYSHILSTVNADVDGERDAYLLICLCGFGYDASTDDYLIVIVWGDDSVETQCEFFSFRTNSWTKIEVNIPPPNVNRQLLPGLFLNGAIHWLLNSNGESTILAFDLTERSFSYIPLPYSVAAAVIGLQACQSCIEMGGCLCFKYVDYGRHEMWVMREYKVLSSWVKYKIFDRSFYPIFFAEGGEIIGMDDSRGGLVKCNSKGQLLARCTCKNVITIVIQ